MPLALKFLRSSFWAFLLGLGMYQVNAIDVDHAPGVQKDPADWATYGNGYANRRYSVLDEIHIDNVARLVPKWGFGIPRHGNPNWLGINPLWPRPRRR